MQTCSRKCVGVGERSAYFRTVGVQNAPLVGSIPRVYASASTRIRWVPASWPERPKAIIPSSCPPHCENLDRCQRRFPVQSAYFFCHGRGSVRNLWVGHWKIQLARKAPDRRAMSMKNESNGAPQIVNRAVGHGLGRGRR